jgi:hypothetical protein
MPEPIKPNKIDGEEFRLICKDLGEGRQISQQEMADALCYANRLPELPELTKALVKGWNISMTRINFKNQRIARLDRQVKALRRQLEKEAGHENA